MSLILDFGPPVSGVAGLSATGTTQSTGYTLAKSINVFTSAVANAWVVLPNAYASGVVIWILNQTQVTFLVGPAEGDQIGTFGINVPVQLPPGEALMVASFDPPITAPPRTWWMLSNGQAQDNQNLVGLEALFSTIPTSQPTTTGTLWLNGGVLCITPGAVVDLTSPLAGLTATIHGLPSTLPTTTGTLWLNNNVVSLTAGAVADDTTAAGQLAQTLSYAPTAAPLAMDQIWIDGGVVAYTGNFGMAMAVAGTIAQLRAQTAQTLTQGQCYVLGYYGGADGGEGVFSFNALDTTSADNGGSIIVDMSGRRWYRNTGGESLSVKWFGARGDDGYDDTASIVATIAALGPSGGTVRFPKPSVAYKVSSTIAIGNGSASAVSTVHGIYLIGEGAPSPPSGFFAGFPTTPACAIRWAGGAAPMFQINGPIQGWGFEGLALDGGGVATRGVNVVSGCFGGMWRCALSNFTDTAVYSTTIATLVSGTTNADSLRNEYRGLSIAVPNVVGAKGIVLTGVYPVADTDFNDVEDISICFSQATPSQAVYGIYLQNCDTNFIRGIHLFGGGSASVGLALDYTQSGGGVWPSANHIQNIDPAGVATPWSVAGTISGGAAPNLLTALGEANGANYPNVSGLNIGLPFIVDQLEFINQTGTIAPVNWFQPSKPGLYRVNYYLVVGTSATGGTLTPVLEWNDNANNKVLNLSVAQANGGYCQGSAVIFIQGSTGPINVGCTAAGITGSVVYYLYFTVERLS